MSQSNPEEIDLGFIFTKIKKSFNNFLISIYYGVQFIFKNWWKILIIVLIGIGVGYFNEKSRNHPKETVLLIQNNFNSSTYVYNAIEQLNNKIKDNDTVYLKKHGFKTNTIVLKKLKIEPIVNIIELLEKTAYVYRPLEQFLEKANFEDELLTSEVFIPEYKYHNLTLKTTDKGSEETIKNLIRFLNENEKYNDLRVVTVESTKKHIKEFEETISDIDSVLKAVATPKGQKLNTQQIYISTGHTADLGDLVDTKLNILNQKTKLAVELAKYDQVVTLMNKPALYIDRPLLSLNMKNTAIIFVVLFLLFSYFKYKYFKIKDSVKAK